MTLDDLIEEFRNCPTTRGGVKRVVEALRDEVDYWLAQDSMYATAGMVERRFNEILTSDAERHLTPQEQDIIHSALRRGVKAAGGPTSNAGGPVEQQLRFVEVKK